MPFCICSEQRKCELILFYLVLSWDGDVSAISRDAIEDVHLAKRDTVIDEWDEDFDRGKVSKR